MSKRKHLFKPQGTDGVAQDLLPFAKEIDFVQGKALIVFGNSFRIWGLTYKDFKDSPYDVLNDFHNGYIELLSKPFDSRNPTLKMEIKVLQCIFETQQSIESAFHRLKKGKIADAASFLASACAWLGQLMVLEELYDTGVLFSFDAINRSKEGAQKGGLASAKTRRSQAKIPQPSILRRERDDLISKGKPTREVAAMLARKYGCTPDHIRKTLKRD